MIRIASLLLALMAAATPAFASEGGGDPGFLYHLTEGMGLSFASSEMIFKTINLLILLFILHKYAKPALVSTLKGSAEQTKAQTQALKEKLAESERQVQDYKLKMETFQSELKEKHENTMAVIQAEKKRIIEDAEAQAKAMEHQAEMRISQSANRAKAEIRAFLAAEATKLAEELLTNKMDQAAQSKLLSDYSKILEKTG